MGSKIFEKFKIVARKKAYQNRSNLKWENNKRRVSMSINVGGGELKGEAENFGLGIGGAGGNYKRDDRSRHGGLVVAINTDAQDLKRIRLAKIQIGMNLTKGLGAGQNTISVKQLQMNL